MPILGVSYSTACEIVYPIGEAMTCGVMQMCASVVSTIVSMSVATIISVEGKGYVDGKFVAVYILILTAIIGWIFQWMVTVRLNPERRSNLKSQKDDLLGDY